MYRFLYMLPGRAVIKKIFDSHGICGFSPKLPHWRHMRLTYCVLKASL